MSLYLIRHAHAIDGEDDAARSLSKRGRRQVRALADFLGRTGALATAELWHSPRVRSRETAAQLVKHLGLDARLIEVDGIDYDDDPATVAARLAHRREPLAIVGHEPHLSALLSLLVTGAAHPVRFVMKKCAAVALDCVDGVWVVRWQVSPEIVGE